MLSPRSTLASALCALVLLQQSTSVNGDFAGSYTRSSISPSICVVPTTCDYQCSAAYTIGVSGSTATLYPTSNPFGCACEMLTASIVGDSASGKGSTSTYSLTRATNGIDVVTSVLGVTCTGSYTKTGSSTVTTSTTTSTTSGSGSVSAHLGLLGVALAAGTALVFSYR